MQRAASRSAPKEVVGTSITVTTFGLFILRRCRVCRNFPKLASCEGRCCFALCCVGRRRMARKCSVHLARACSVDYRCVYEMITPYRWSAHD